MSIAYQKVPPFPFYSLRQFIQLQPLIRNKSTIYLYQHISSLQIFAVKQVPYRQQTIKIYEIIMRRQQQLDSIVRIRGLCLMIIKYDIRAKRTQPIDNKMLEYKIDQNISNVEIKNHRKNQSFKQTKSLLIFMEKCQCDLLEVIRIRRSQKKYFHPDQISSFIRQILILLETLEKDGVSHRDIKPQNILYDHGRYRLCDFETAIYIQQFQSQPQQSQYLDLTTLQYSSPEFYKNFRETKKKIFDPFKLDVYALGITILYMCSLGKFDLFQRKQFMIEGSQFHHQYMKQQRRKILKNNDYYKNFNTIVKNMLQEDQYKRDTFQTLMLKMTPILNIKSLAIDSEQISSDQTKSQESKNYMNPAISPKRHKSRKNLWPGTTQIQRKSLFSMLIFGLSFFILILII